MEIVNKPDIQVFASEAKTGEILKFPDVLRGWGITLDQTQGKPPLEWMNDAFNRIDLNNLYLLQQGIPEWSKDIRYPVNSIIKHTGKIYLCSVENENNEPSASSDKWSLYIRNASEKDAGIAKVATQTEVNAGTNDTSFVTPKKLKVKIDAIPEASLTEKGLAQLTNNIDDSENKAVTPKAVNTVKKKADQVPNPVKDNFIVGNDEKGYKLMTAEQVKALLAVPKQVNVVNEVGQSATDAISQKAFTDLSFGIGQEWFNVKSERVAGQIYTNTTSKTIVVAIDTSSGTGTLKVSKDGENWVNISPTAQYFVQAPVPQGHKYKLTGGVIDTWAELR